MVGDDRLGGYADALLAVAAAEGASEVVEDELFRFAEALRGSEPLMATVSDRGLSLERRQAVVEDLLGSSASAITTALVSMVVGTGRGADLPAIVDEAVVRSAAGRNRALARVRSAIELTDDQKSRLAAAIKSSTGTDVEIRVVSGTSSFGPFKVSAQAPYCPSSLIPTMGMCGSGAPAPVAGCGDTPTDPTAPSGSTGSTGSSGPSSTWDDTRSGGCSVSGSQSLAGQPLLALALLGLLVLRRRCRP